MTSARWRAGLLFLGLLAIYNSNGREIGGIDSQPAKFAARAVVLEGTMAVDRDVRRAPLLAERPSFALDRNGHYRSAYSPVPILLGSITAWILKYIARIDLDAPRAANLIAVLTASAVTAAAVVLVFVTLTRFSRTSTALLVALGLGLGTNYWGMLSRTLGQHDVVALGVALALFAWTRPDAELTARRRWLGAAGLALAATARLQTAPMVLVLALGVLVRVGWRRALGPLALVAAGIAALVAVQWYWFGHPLGAVPRLERLHPAIHGVSGSLSTTPWVGAAGLLVSPNRGLLVFSPVALIALVGMRRSVATLRGHGAGWLLTAAAVQFVVYAMYSVWWGGHTYGPRYLLDLLVLLTPSAAIAVEALLRRPWARALGAAALVWSIAVAGTGAFFSERWNTDPDEIDRNHVRLWDWRDPQILRAWDGGLNAQNFNLFNWTVLRQQE
jgi:hypothetical protein